MKDLEHLPARISSLQLYIFPVFNARIQISQTPNLKFPQTIFGSNYLKGKKIEYPALYENIVFNVSSKNKYIFEKQDLIHGKTKSQTRTRLK